MRNGVRERMEEIRGEIPFPPPSSLSTYYYSIHELARRLRSYLHTPGWLENLPSRCVATGETDTHTEAHAKVRCVHAYSSCCPSNRRQASPKDRPAPRSRGSYTTSRRYGRRAHEEYGAP
ncbi:hypothetical protein MTO96_006264 [Rhipicephalus appendiculatus]